MDILARPMLLELCTADAEFYFLREQHSGTPDTSPKKGESLIKITMKSV